MTGRRAEQRVCISGAYVWFGLGAASGGAQGVFLALHPGIIPGGAQGTLGDARIPSRVSQVQGKGPSAVLSL